VAQKFNAKITKQKQQYKSMEKKLKSWQGWTLFAATLVIVFILGMIAASITERRAEVATIFNNKRTIIEGIESRNEMFAANYPRQYETWTQTADMSFHSFIGGNQFEDILEQRPNMVILWAGNPFSKDYNAPRGHSYAITDLYNTLRTGAPMTCDEGPQNAACWSCKSSDVPRLYHEVGVDNFFAQTWAAFGSEVVHPVGCANCHEPTQMRLQISQPALIEAFERQGRSVRDATQQEMRSLVCAQCHVEYYFKNQQPTFPWDKGMSMEQQETYYDEIGFHDFLHAISRAPILKAQHPDYEIAFEGIHAQRGVSCADCHMPYQTQGGVKFSNHHIMSPLANMERSCQVCHRESEATLRQNVLDRQMKANEPRNRLEYELSRAHIEAGFAWEKGATEAQMRDILQLLRQSQWRWDFGVASHGGSFHAPQEIQRILGDGLDRALQARLAIARLLPTLGHIGPVPMPDISTKEKAQAYIGLDMAAERAAKQRFLDEIVPEWLKEAKENNRM
jgi:nitrite reductase (cytochrome c-552)